MGSSVDKGDGLEDWMQNDLGGVGACWGFEIIGKECELLVV